MAPPTPARLTDYRPAPVSFERQQGRFLLLIQVFVSTHKRAFRARTFQPRPLVIIDG